MLINPLRWLAGGILSPGKEGIVQHFTRDGAFVGQTDIAYRKGRFVGRFYTKDAFDPMALQFRASAGFPGSVTRMNPATIEPALVDSAAPPLGFGYAVIADISSTEGVRQVASGDSSLTDIYGVVVRSFPGQDPGVAGAYGALGFNAGSPPTKGTIDILRAGYIIVPLNGSVYKGSPVYVWCAASSSPHVQGAFEAAASSGNTISIASAKTTYNGPADVNGNVELALNI
jgi:hypothetical protein